MLSNVPVARSGFQLKGIKAITLILFVRSVGFKCLSDIKKELTDFIVRLFKNRSVKLCIKKEVFYGKV